MNDIAVSNSEIACFKRCRRKWWLSYYLCLGTKPSETYLAGVQHLGTRVHLALERYYGHGEDPIEAEQKLYEASRAVIVSRGNVQELHDFDGDHDYAKRMLEGYMQWLAETGEDAGFEIIGAEQEVRVPSGLAGVDLRGKLDVRVRRRSDGRRVFIDHKTGASVDIKTIEIQEQFPFYALLERLLAQQSDEKTALTDGGVINVLKRVKRTFKAKPPFYKRHEVRFNPHQLRSMWARVHAVIAQILTTRHALDAGQDHQEVAYPTPASDCDWSCPFFQVCPLFDDGSRWEDAVAAHYVTVDPYARYDSRSVSSET